jgi:hypothetical protein
MDIDLTGTVDDLIWELENHLGQENLYKIIFAGKLLKEQELLCEFNFSNKTPLIVMVTKPRDIETNIVDAEHEEKTMTDQYETGNDFEIVKRVRTVTEDSGFEEDISSCHFVTDVEFKNVVEIIQSCEYLRKNGEQALSIKEIKILLTTFCQNENIENILFNNVILDRIDAIVTAKLNKSQLKALFEDVQSIFDEMREHPVDKSQYIVPDIANELPEENEFEDNLKRSRLTDMGFTDKEAEDALKESYNNLQAAVEILIPTSNEKDQSSLTSTTSKSNPLAFLRDIDEFQFLRYRVLQDPLQLQPLLLSFGQSHPDIMRIINQNKDIFVNMLHEQTGAKLSGRH